MAVIQIQVSATTTPMQFLMVDNTDHVTGKTGLTPTVTISKNNAAFASPSGDIHELANGWYYVSAAQSDFSTLGSLILHATGTSADPVDTMYQVVSYNPNDNVRLGLTALPNAAAAASNGLLTAGTGANQISTSAGQVLIQGGQIVGSVTGNVGGNVTGSVGSVVASVVVGSVSAGVTVDANMTKILGTTVQASAGYVGLDWGSIVNKATTNNLSGTTFSTSQNIASVTGSVGSVTASVVVGSVSAGVTVAANMTQVNGVAVPASAGYVAVDWGTLVNKTATNALTGTTVSTSQSIASVTGAVGSVTASVIVGSVSAGVTVPSNMTQVNGVAVPASAGYVAIDWGTIVNKGATNNFTATTISTVTTVSAVAAGGLTDLTVTTFAEPSSPPSATDTLKNKINWLGTVARNKITQTATTQLIRNDADSGTIGTSTVSDDGTTATRGKYS